MTGAAQHRVPCPHLDQSRHRNAELCMASQISRANLEFFVSEGRVADGVSKDDLRDWYGQADQVDGTLVCCNSCDRVLVVGDGDPAVLHDGEPESEHDGLDAEPEIRPDLEG